MRDELLVVHDAHPQYASTLHAAELPAAEKRAVQHHRAHIASVLAERGAWDERVIGVSFDGTGYGDDGTIWGGEIFAGSVRAGFERVAHLRAAALPGGDAAASHPVQAAAGFLAQLERSAGFDGAAIFISVALSAMLCNWCASKCRDLSAPLPWGGSSIQRRRCLASRARSPSKDKPRCGWSALPAQRIAHGRCVSVSICADDELDFRPLLAWYDSRSAAWPRVS